MKNPQNPNTTLPTDAEMIQILETLALASEGSENTVTDISSESDRTAFALPDSPQADDGQCPALDSILCVASGAAEKIDAQHILSHVCACDKCAKFLAQGLHIMNGDPSPEETAAVAELAAAKSDWQRTLARQLASTPSQRKRRFFEPVFNRSWGLAAAGIAVFLAIGTVLFWQLRMNTPDRQLAMAYSQSRNLELRIPEARYAGFAANGHTRGGLTEEESAPLLEARARLARELERAPLNPHWQQLQARADVLEEHYDSAVDLLDRLLAAGPVTSGLLTDAASAYYQRGLVSGNESDRSTALDYLRRADQLAPTDPVVLFNEAIVMEDRGQVMNAVEVWNRYLIVERDAQWANEGRRKLAALEQTLNRLKFHAIRIPQILASPAEMDRLARNEADLFALDEELTSVELDKLLLTAFPIPTNQQHESAARGSPCDPACQSARTLLKALSNSLEIHHHDSWLADLLSADLNSLPAPVALTYTRAVQSLAKATREDQTGFAADGFKLATSSLELFHELGKTARFSPALRPAVRAGEARATVEVMFAKQRIVDYGGCRDWAKKIRSAQIWRWTEREYPWIYAVAMLTNKVCDDTPATRLARLKLGLKALSLAEADNYQLLVLRTQLRFADDALLIGNDEEAERLAIATLRQLYSSNAPLVRIINTQTELQYVEEETPRAYTTETCLRELLAWLALTPDNARSGQMRMALARSELRIGEMKSAEDQMRLAQQEGQASAEGQSHRADFFEQEFLLASTMLERADLTRASFYLDQASKSLGNYSDIWGLRTYTSVLGQLDLMRNDLDRAATALEAQIRRSEGIATSQGDPTTSAENALQDHDLYAELAATWLAQHRPPENVLALWERFRLRSHGIPITACRGLALDCEEPQVKAAEHLIDGNVLIGQIVLIDRVLTYKMDETGVSWSEKKVPRREVLDAAQNLGRAVSSPITSAATADRLSAHLSDSLLPHLPANLGLSNSLLLEPDPMLQNLPWPVLSTAGGPLGIQYPLSEVRSILLPSPKTETHIYDSRNDSISYSGSHALVVGASVAGEGELPLPEVLNEAQHVNQLLHSSGALLGSKATAASVAKALGTATIFHFAGHALQGTQGTELLLAPASPHDEMPWIDEALLRQNPPRQCRLAVLSACATGNRQASGRNPLQNMVDTLSFLGVPQVVATRWQIDSEAAVPFVDSFYRNIAQGTTVAMALTSARRLQFSQSHFNHPYYWGAYYATGSEISQPRREPHVRR